MKLPDLTLDEAVDMLAEKCSLSKERTEFIRMFAKADHSKREEIMIHLACLGLETFMKLQEKE